MLKVIVVRSCQDCPYSRLGEMDNGRYSTDYYCSKDGKPILDPEKIHDLCKLHDLFRPIK